MYFVTFLVKNLTRRKTRSALTVLGVAVAVGTMVTLLGVSYGFEESFIDAFQHRGADLVVTAAGQVDQLRSDLPEDLTGQMQAISGVKEVRPGLLEMVSVKKGSSDISVFVNGWPTDSSLFHDLTILSGRKIAPGDHRQVMLGETLATNLNKQTGDTIEMQEETFTVIGTYRSFNVFENGGLILPLAETQQLMDRKGRVTGFTVIVHDTPERSEVAARVAKEIEQLKDDKGRSYRIAARPAQDYVKDSMPIKLAHGMAWITSIIAAFIGAVSMLNTMLTSVLERIKEIGILRAMGWRKSRVIRMILGEALVLSLIGAILGCVGAIVVVRWLSTLSVTSGFVQGNLPPIALLYGLVTAIAVALVGGSWPAWRAAQWLPTEALRHD